MRYFNALFGWLWRRKIFLAVIFASAAFFTVMRFPFNDLSDAITSAISAATGNQVYLQAQEMNIHLFPQPAISADGLRVETTLPAIEAKWAKITPGLFGLIFNAPSLLQAARGGSAQALMTHISGSVDAEGVFGGDVELGLGSGKKSENGHERSRITLSLSEINLKEVQQWADLPVNMQGKASAAADLQVVPDFQDQPEGEYEFKIAKFVMPAGVVNVPMGEASMPINLPAISLANVNFKGRLVGGSLVIEDGAFGQSKDPLYGRIKGQIALRLIPSGQGLVPQFGSYNLTVDLTTNATIQKEIGFAFLPLESAKQPTSDGGAKYLFKAAGQGIGMAYVPSITRTPTF
jgi:type II secretion system protein N